MATNFSNTLFLFPLLILFFFYFAGTSSSAATVTPTTNFIKASCATTTYPALCVESLSGYATAIQRSPSQLVQAALSVSLERTGSTQSYLNKLNKFRGLKPREKAAIRDCLEEVSDSIDRVSKSIQELKSFSRAKGQSFIWHMSNVQTWVSSALTDENTCTDGFAGRAMEGRLKTSVRARITDVAHVTSNALNLVNKFAKSH